MAFLAGMILEKWGLLPVILYLQNSINCVHYNQKQIVEVFYDYEEEIFFVIIYSYSLEHKWLLSNSEKELPSSQNIANRLVTSTERAKSR